MNSRSRWHPKSCSENNNRTLGRSAICDTKARTHIFHRDTWMCFWHTFINTLPMGLESAYSLHVGVGVGVCEPVRACRMIFVTNFSTSHFYDFLMHSTRLQLSAHCMAYWITFYVCRHSNLASNRRCDWCGFVSADCKSDQKYSSNRFGCLAIWFSDAISCDFIRFNAPFHKISLCSLRRMARKKNWLNLAVCCVARSHAAQHVECRDWEPLPSIEQTNVNEHEPSRIANGNNNTWSWPPQSVLSTTRKKFTIVSGEIIAFGKHEIAFWIKYKWNNFAHVFMHGDILISKQ